MEMMCIMHQGTPYGTLTLHKKPIAPSVLARMVGASTSEVSHLLTELEAARVFSRTSKSVIVSRRMQRDDLVRKARADGGQKSLNNPKVPRPKETEGYPL